MAECDSVLWLTMAPHSSALAWKIPWTEEPGGLQSMGLRRVRHDWATSLSLFTFTHWRRKWQPTPVFLPGESQGREPGALQSMGSRRVGHDWSDLAAVFYYIYVYRHIYIYIYIYFITLSLSIYLLMDTGCFHILAVAYNDAMSIEIHVCSWISGLLALFIHTPTWVEFLGHMVVLFLAYLRNFYLFSKMAHQFTLPLIL